MLINNNYIKKKIMDKLEIYKNIECFFPKTIGDIEKLVCEETKEAEIAVNNIIELKHENRTFLNTVYAFDVVQSRFYTLIVLLQAVESVNPSEEMRNAAYHNGLKLRAHAIDHFLQNIDIYKTLKTYAEILAHTENLNDEQKYFLEKLLKAYEHNGLHLLPEKLDRLKNIKKELEEHKLSFKRNINIDTPIVELAEEQLKGLSTNFIGSLKKNNNKYILQVDSATYNEVMESCEVEDTRKTIWRLLFNRGYPANKNELAQIIALRDEWAKMIGYNNFADLDISTQMARTVDTVEHFVNDIIGKAEDKFCKEMIDLKKHLPESVVLSEKGKFKFWDIHFVKSVYKKQYLALSEEDISAYFPFDYTFKQLLAIYEQFFGLILQTYKNVNLWHETVNCVAVYKGNVFLGTIILDLFSRQGKAPYAFFLDIAPAMLSHKRPAIGLVVASFSNPINKQPALLKLANVRTFFHEFGHALHGILGATLMPSLAGTRVKSDFVEMPSQMLEEWMWNPEVLKFISKHYQTGESLPEKVIQKILELKHFDSGYWIKRQASLAKLSLELYKDGKYKNIEEIQKNIFSTVVSCVEYDDDNHDYASFWHLIDYGSKYYSYLWSKIFALDLFDKIKESGLFNKEIGKNYIDKILSKGGSAEPQELINNFLGRESNTDAFFKDLRL